MILHEQTGLQSLRAHEQTGLQNLRVHEQTGQKNLRALGQTELQNLRALGRTALQSPRAGFVVVHPRFLLRYEIVCDHEQKQLSQEPLTHSASD